MFIVTYSSPRSVQKLFIVLVPVVMVLPVRRVVLM